MTRFLIVLLLFPMIAGAQERTINKPREPYKNVKYEKNRSIDLGGLTVDGEIVSPEDFSISDENQGKSKKLYRRKDFNDRLLMNIDYLL